MDDEQHDGQHIDEFGLSQKSSVTSRLIDVPLRELEDTYKKRSGQNLNRLKPQEVSLAINWWLEETHPNKYLGAFWTGLELPDDGSSPNPLWRFVCIAAK